MSLPDCATAWLCHWQLEGREFNITEKGPFSFEIDCDTSECGTFVSGYVNQV